MTRFQVRTTLVYTFPLIKIMTKPVCFPLTGLKKLTVLAVLTSIFAFNGHAQTLVQKWRNPAPGSTTARHMAYNQATGHLLLVNSVGPTISLFKSSDGTADGTVSVTGVAGGTFTLNGIATLPDGTIFACNYVTGAQSTSPLKIYKWLDETDQNPTVVASLGTLLGSTSDRFGSGLRVFIRPGVSTNFLIGGTLTSAYFLENANDVYTFKHLVGFGSQQPTPGPTFVDYGSGGSSNFRIIGKSRGTSGSLYSFNPAATEPISVGTATSMTAPFAFAANGITTHDYDPDTGLLAGTTSTIQAPFVWMGMNSITIYVTSNVIGGFRKLAGRFVGGDIKAYFETNLGYGSGDLLVAATGLLLAFLYVRFLYKRKIFLRL